MKWWIGCSGFYYPEWKELFYPVDLPKNNWFEFYCKTFNSVEINATFYKFPKIDFFKNWFDRSPDNFKFSVKVPRIITHYKRFKNSEKEIEDLYNVASLGLKDKLGCILFQLHPDISYSELNLELIINSLNSSFSNVVEFRHESWWKSDVINELEKNGTTFCNISHPTLPDEVVRTAPIMYYRFHGVPYLYQSNYSEADLRYVIGALRNSENVTECYMYFNNTMQGAAVRNARLLQEFSEEKSIAGNIGRMD